MVNSLHLLCWDEPTADEKCLSKLADFLGIPVRMLSLADASYTEPTSDQRIHFISTCQTLRSWWGRRCGRDWLMQALADRNNCFFITGFRDSEEDRELVSSLSGGVVESVSPVESNASCYEICTERAAGFLSFTGLKFGPIDPSADCVFRLSQRHEGVSELISINRKPCYMRIAIESAPLFLLACRKVLDLDSPLKEGTEILDCFLQFVPFLVHLRASFDNRCWHNDRPAACFIIDDPLLRSRYGFLDFEILETRMNTGQFSTNIGFIPWNCRRTDPRIGAKFKQEGSRFSISIHGCDHTEGEFGLTDEHRLRAKARLALKRMAIHESVTGIKHNRVMVFPQGVFSKASLRILREEGFLAAVNSTSYAVDAQQDELTYRDVLGIAVLRFDDLPLFLREYPGKVERLALDIFLGKQVILVGHHEFFKRGYETIEHYAHIINALEPRTVWTDLEDLCTSACLIRETDGLALHVRVFGPVARIRNCRGQRRLFCVEKRVEHEELVQMVMWKGIKKCFETHGGTIQCHVELDPWEEGDLAFIYIFDKAAETFVPPTASERIKVFLRRHLCELRDNYLSKSRFLSRLAKVGKELLPRL